MAEITSDRLFYLARASAMSQVSLLPRIILASASPRRQELLIRVGIAVDVVPADVNESTREGEPADVYAARLAASKADAVARSAPDRIVLAADTVVEVGGVILGKAPSPDRARQMLESLVGRRHRVVTAFAVRGGVAPVDRQVATDVVMRQVLSSELDDYVAAGEWRGKAGAYAVQGMAAAFVSSVHGSITNVIGLPLSEVVEALREAGFDTPRYSDGAPA